MCVCLLSLSPLMNMALQEGWEGETKVELKETPKLDHTEFYLGYLLMDNLQGKTFEGGNRKV